MIYLMQMSRSAKDFLFILDLGCSCPLDLPFRHPGHLTVRITDISPINLVVCTDIHRHNRFFVNEQFDGYSITDIDGNGMQTL